MAPINLDCAAPYIIKTPQGSLDGLQVYKVTFHQNVHGYSGTHYYKELITDFMGTVICNLKLLSQQEVSRILLAA